MKFHPAKQHCSKDMRPYMESPWSVVFKYTFTFNFLIYSGMVLGCQRKCPILPKTTKNGKNSQKWPIFKWNSTQLNVPDDQKKIYPYFLHTIRHSKNNSHFTLSHFCYFQLYLLLEPPDGNVGREKRFQHISPGVPYLDPTLIHLDPAIWGL